MSKIERYRSEPLKCWPKAKELREKFYREYFSAHKEGKIRWCGSAFACEAIPQGIEEVVHIYSEPYAAMMIAMDPYLTVKCQESVEKRGFSRDLCAYLRNYWGAMFLNRSIFGGEFPKPDFYFTTHVCCTHGKWAQQVAEYENIPAFGIDLSVGPYNGIKEHKIEYVASQMADAIEWLEKITKKKYDDEKLIEAIHTECQTTSLWGEICALNKAIPAPLDEKAMFSLYVLVTLRKCSKEVLSFYKELRDEVKDRIERGIAAVPTERLRLLTDSQPPWSLLNIWRYLEKYGVVCVGSIYTFALIGMIEEDEEGVIRAAKTPEEKGIQIRNREEALHVYADWSIRRPIYMEFYHSKLKSDLMIKMVKQWDCKGVIMHLNRGCEGTAIGQMENRIALREAGIPVMIYEANMGDDRECDEGRIFARIDSFMESLGLHKIDKI
jgi:benzoyl-CoA reductase subunit B